MRPWLAGFAGGSVIWISTFVAAGLVFGFISGWPASARQWAGLSLLLFVTFGMSIWLARWVGTGGEIAGAVAGVTQSLLLLSMMLTATPEDVFNPLIFSAPGLIGSALVAAGGGWLGARWARRSASAGRRAAPGLMAHVGVQAMLMWLGLEFLVRMSGSGGLGAMVGGPLGGDMLAVLAMMPSGVWWIVRYAEKKGVSRQDWGYRWDRQALLAGLAGGVLIMGLLYLTAWVDSRVFGLGGEGVGPAVESAWVGWILLGVNGMVVPVLEEWVWRGVVQTSLVRVWGLAVGATVTAVAFALKHVVIDASVARLTTLLMFAAVVGLVRTRWGTGASTVAHVVANTTATAMVVYPWL